MSGAQVAPDGDRLAGLVFELASQLHVERARRLALEAALQRSGVIDRASIDALASDPGFQDGSRAALEESIRRLMRVLAEGRDPRRPLVDRGEAAGGQS
ncbi:MAG: hypothetical protein ACT4UP_10695 [Gammaproteobacteria bacterium]